MRQPLEAQDSDAFERLVEPYRREVQLHCYRMLGSIYDAQDLVQETFLRAWRGFDRLDRQASIRSWLYRIATNACLNALASRKAARRVLPESIGTPANSKPGARQDGEVAWIEPYPDSVFAELPDAAPGPDARYDLRESVQLAFIAAIQRLSPQQRAVLLSRDVMGWSARETAELLGSTPTAVHSALQRARRALHRHSLAGGSQGRSAPDEAQVALVDRYVRAWEAADIHGLVALLQEDAVLSMPPQREWYQGREVIRRFLAGAWAAHGGPGRLVRTAANGETAFAQYMRPPGEQGFGAHAIWLPTWQKGKISVLTGFRDPGLFVPFGLPPTIEFGP